MPAPVFKLTMSSLVVWFILALTFQSFLVVVEGTTVSACPSATTFAALVTCLLDSDHMPRENSNGFVVPDDVTLNHWYNAVRDILALSKTSSCGTITLQGSLSSLYEYVSFSDSTGDYCVLAEIALVGASNKKGWGTFITRLNSSRNLHFQVPHPIFDENTGEQNADIFEQTQSRSFLLTGTHRNANTALSSCQGSCNGDYKESDAAHNIKHMFHSTTRATQDWHDNEGTGFVVLQLHGFAAAFCATDMFLTYGRPTCPSAGDCLKNLQSNLRAVLPGPISVPGELACECQYNGGSNTQGRMLNGVDPNQVCDTDPSTYSGRFIHIEQEPQFRETSAYIQAISSALVTTFPTGGECSPQPTTSGWISWLQEKALETQRVFFSYNHQH